MCETTHETACVNSSKNLATPPCYNYPWEYERTYLAHAGMRASTAILLMLEACASD